MIIKQMIINRAIRAPINIELVILKLPIVKIVSAAKGTVLSDAKLCKNT